jgi:hypothetical protein
MDELKPEFWAQQWTAFWSAPAIMGPLLLIVGFVVWWFRGTMFEREVACLKEQVSVLEKTKNGEISVLEQRMKLAADGLGRAKDDLANLDKQFEAYKAEVAAKGKNASPAMVDATMRAGLKIALRELEMERVPKRGLGMPPPRSNWLNNPLWMSKNKDDN